MCLSNHISMWKMELLLDVDQEVLGIENVVLTGTVYTRVYCGFPHS